MKNYIENKIFNNHLLFREPLPPSALLYTNDTETNGYSINRLFSVSVPADFPYVAVKFDWCSTAIKNAAWAYNRDVCGITVRGHFMSYSNLQKVCKPLNNSSAMNEASLYTIYPEKTTDIVANNTDERTYTTINYAWHNNTTGFSAAVAGIWRYRDARSNNISTLSNITCTNEQGGSFQSTFYCKNVRIACFNNAEDCLKTTW